ncbi:MAG: DUF6516 family protein [Candidatus Woesearchaeota archaeon]|jgi:hypothetical protein|nr:DUF6516 family protein [Candidatus Woesearchaeota archaeon]MDP7506032.1 DUF6516 family protein [Candidatus Woesearchaeota archaeon]|tara:strand:- start:1068 stop:1376 length:309 start_codon:yes stop_codon:yes gene_type:complete
MSKAIPIIEPNRKVTEKGNIIAFSAWEVPISESYPEGVKYSLVLICNNKRIIGFDNFNNEGHHRHYLKENVLVKEELEFKNLEDTINKFLEEVNKFEIEEVD